MTHFAGRAGKVLFLSVLTAMLLVVTALAADIATGAGCTTGSSLRLRAEPTRLRRTSYAVFCLKKKKLERGSATNPQLHQTRDQQD